MTEEKRPLLLVVSAPSGAGKSTLCNRLIKKFPEMIYSVSCTTRAPRGEEKNHVHYHFFSEEEFCERIESGAFLEHACVHGFRYGTLKKSVEDVLSEGRDLIMDIDVQGANQIREACKKMDPEDPVRKGFTDIFIAPPSLEELRKRLHGRSTDSMEVIEKRLRNAEEEMQCRDRYRYLIINDNLDEAVEEFTGIVDAEHATPP